MGLDVAPIGPTSLSRSPEPAQRGAAAATTRVEDTAELSPDQIPASPPREVLEAMDAAGRVARELHAEGRELRFVPDHDGGHVQVQVRDLDGHVLRTIPPNELLDVATGSPLD